MDLPDQVAIPGPGNHILIRAYALAECGRLPEASRLATAAYEATPRRRRPALMWLAHQIGRCALLAGQLATARRWLTEALARSEDGGLPGPRCLVLSALATAAAGLGDAEAAAAAVRDLDRLEPFPFTRPEQELGRAGPGSPPATCRAPARSCGRGRSGGRGRLPGLRGVAAPRCGPAGRAGHRRRPPRRPGGRVRGRPGGRLRRPRRSRDRRRRPPPWWRRPAPSSTWERSCSPPRRPAKAAQAHQRHGDRRAAAAKRGQPHWRPPARVPGPPGWPRP